MLNEEKPIPPVGGRPFRSKLRPYVAEIRGWRKSGLTWDEVAHKLTTERGCPTDGSNVCKFLARYRKRPFASDGNPNGAAASSATVAGPKSPQTVPSSAPDFDAMVDEAEQLARAEPTVFKRVKPNRPL
jgi:hypothetical protein